MSRSTKAREEQTHARKTGRTFVEVIDPTHSDFVALDADTCQVPLIIVENEIPEELMVRVLTIKVIGQTEPSIKKGFEGMVFDRFEIRYVVDLLGPLYPIPLFGFRYVSLGPVEPYRRDFGVHRQDGRFLAGLPVLRAPVESAE